MEYYIEQIFLENYIVNFVILYILNLFLKSHVKLIKLLSINLISTIYVLIIYINNIENIFLKIMLAFVVTYIIFAPSRLKAYFQYTFLYLLFNFLYLGIIISITVLLNISINILVCKILVYLISALLLYLMTSVMWKMWKTNIKKENITYIVNIQGQEINCYVDTGNLVKNLEYNLDVIFLDSRWYDVLNEKGILKKKVNTYINSVTSNMVSYGYIVENVYVYKEDLKNKKGKNIYKINKIIISFSNQKINIDGKYTGLIGYNTYLENLGGG